MVTLSKNSIPTPCEYEEPLNLTQVSCFATPGVHYSTSQFYPGTARNTDKIRTLAQQIYCLSVSHNPMGDVNIVQNGQFLLLRSEWLDTSTGIYLVCGEDGGEDSLNGASD